MNRPNRCYMICLAGILAWATTGTVKGDSLTIPFYTGTILPSPQKATWYDEFLDLSNTAIVPGRNLDVADGRVNLLIEYVQSLGGRAKVVNTVSPDHSTVIAVGDTPFAQTITPPEKEEGYIIAHTTRDGKPVVILKGSDSRGLLWAVVSLRHVMTLKEGKPVLRKVEVADYPEYHHRGLLINGVQDVSVQDWARFVVLFKLTALQFNNTRIDGDPGTWNEYLDKDFWRTPPTPEWNEALKRLAKTLNPLEIDWYVGISLVRGEPADKIDSKDEKDFQAVLNLATQIAEAGGGLNLMYDDTRFPMNPADVKNFGSAREADVYFINKVYKAVKAKYPNFKMTFCPPFYWGPEYPPLSYGEDRDAYLRAIGNNLPKEIGIYWTGRAVWGGKVKKEEVEWITDRIKRKPWFWQNGRGVPRTTDWHFYTEPVDTFAWHYDGFYRDVYYTWPGYSKATSFYAAMADYLWNPKAYDKNRSVRNAADKIFGAKSWPALVDMTQTLSKMDKWEFKVTPAAVRHLNEIEKNVCDIERTWQRCLASHPHEVKKWTFFSQLTPRYKNYVASLKNMASGKDFAEFTKQADEVLATAKKETGCDPAKDVFLSPYDFSGGKPPKPYDFECEKRLATWVYGARTDYNSMTAGLKITTPPTKATYELVICGQDDDSESKCRIRIAVNQNTVFEGENPFVRFGWSRHTFAVKGAFLKEGENTITISNLEDSENRQEAPFFMLNYAALRAVKK